MCEFAAIAGADPERHSLRELALMAKAADVALWCQTFAIIAQIYNANRGGEGEPIDPAKFYRWRDDRQAAPPSEGEREMLRQYFNSRKKRRR